MKSKTDARDGTPWRGRHLNRSARNGPEPPNADDILELGVTGSNFWLDALLTDLFESAELEFLYRSPRGCVSMPPCRGQFELFPENNLQAFRVIAGNGQAAACGWPVQCKGADRGFASIFESRSQHANICLLPRLS